MQRLAEKNLKKWATSTRRKPLLLRGARQVGKTWLIEHSLARAFDHFIKIDLEKRRDLHTLFGDNLDPLKIVAALEIIYGRIIPGKTLIFLDEIQACPRAIMALRYFYEEYPELHIVGAGSLLEFAFSEIPVPVGRIQYQTIYPMTFSEYLKNTGKEGMAASIFGDPADIPTPAHHQLLQELHTYFHVGGMPECVKTWRDSSSLIEVYSNQSDILDSYRDDFSKYTPRTDLGCLDAILLGSAKSVGDQLKYSRLNDNHSSAMNRKAFDLLTKARMLHKVPSCNPSGLPLGATANPKKFKASFIDIGLMQRLCQIPFEQSLSSEKLLAIYRGRLAEQFVAQELLANGGGALFYWAREARSSSAEIDFLTVRDGIIYPIEVKSGAAGSLRSLHLMLKSYPNCPEGLVISTRPYSVLPEQKLRFIPIYSTAAWAPR